MIPPRPSPLARQLGTIYFRRRARRRLAGVWGARLEGLAAWDRQESGTTSAHPLIIVANHPGWWDAVMPILVSLDRFDHDAYGIMEERQLERFRFFTRLGMFSIDRDDPRSALATLEYAADLLRGSRRVLWYFPQGAIVPNDRRPITVAGGLARLAERIGEVTLLPLAIRYELLDQERPEAWLLGGEAIELGGDSGGADRGSSDRRDELTALITGRLTGVVDQLRECVLERRTDEFERILSGRASIDAWWSRVRGNRSLHGS